jgi:uncharacterized protein YbjT (DUF2867 family)
MNLIVGATGLVGGEVCRMLTEAGKPVRAMVRPAADKVKTEKLSKLGTRMVEADLKDAASLESACKDVHTLISTASATVSRGEGDSIETVDREGQLNLIDAARAAGVRHFIYLSFSGNIDADSPLRNAKRAVEKKLIKSNLTYTILRPTFFMEVWLSPHLGFDYTNAKAQIYGSGNNKISWISLVNVAQFAVMAIDHPDAKNQVIELGGPEALSPLEAVRVFEDVAGRKFEITHVPEQALLTQRSSATDLLGKTIAALMLEYAKGDSIPMKNTLQRFPIQLVSVSDYAKRVLGK